MAHQQFLCEERSISIGAIGCEYRHLQAERPAASRRKRLAPRRSLRHCERGRSCHGSKDRDEAGSRQARPHLGAREAPRTTDGRALTVTWNLRMIEPIILSNPIPVYAVLL